MMGGGGYDAFTLFLLLFGFLLMPVDMPVCVPGLRQAAPDLGSSPDWQLRTSVELTRAGVAALLLHKVHCRWSGHGGGRHNRQKIKIQLREGGEGGLWKSQCPSD